MCPEGNNKSQESFTVPFYVSCVNKQTDTQTHKNVVSLSESCKGVFSSGIVASPEKLLAGNTTTRQKKKLTCVERP